MSELLSTFGINWKLLLAQMFNFSVLLLALWWFLYRPVLDMVAKRQSVIEKGVADAKDAEKKLQNAETEATKLVSGASGEAQEVLANARARADEKSSEMIGSAREQADRIVKEAQMHADEAKKQAIKDSEKEIAKAAVLAAEKILREGK
ncbi:MAG: ATP synthase F0 subunit B [Candidatus Harrisonbacteria bacterium CG10_big_fil_rev_8_21_14_0_10_42_17]|uniref:ATP synthase subunit b n=1 Tax=Candidatus Harrisonbacteria bacterium CG10_big_fil_rev_8_21_14_0_10_42_17 TaxID=1974584 RepID=A0A2M6WIA2_9BACT|nr:MAG: ATP synthase F0 subunit B [Candidatus Harrisonbacteria bacterium CG10_big_fil_rev_8_21_14_0_10_42_17]